MAAERHLRVIDADGQVHESCPACETKDGEYAELERKFRAAMREISRLKNDRGREAKTHPRLAEIKEVFDYWRQKCRHPKSKLDADRTLLIAPYIEEHGLELCKRAIDGAAFDCYVTRRKNGSAKRHDGIDLIFRSAEKYEEFVNRAPKAAPPPAEHPSAGGDTSTSANASREAILDAAATEAPEPRP